MKAKYRHMLPRETRIWDKYLDLFGVPAGRIGYDVHLGDGLPFQPAWPEWMRRMVKTLSTHRVDVLIERENTVTIIEIKRVAGFGALGQLLGYGALWVREHGVGRDVHLMCLCERAEADAVSAFRFYDIEVVELGALLD